MLRKTVAFILICVLILHFCSCEKKPVSADENPIADEQEEITETAASETIIEEDFIITEEIENSEIKQESETVIEESLTAEKTEISEPDSETKEHEPLVYFCECDYCENARIAVEGVTPAKLQIRFIADESNTHLDTVNEYVDISENADYHVFIEPNGFVKTLFTTEKTISDFQFISLKHSFQRDENCCDEVCLCTFIEDILYSLEELTPEKPLFTEWRNIGCFTTNRGISFVYDGVRRYFNIILSNKSGHLFLSEFEPNFAL